MKTGSVKKRIAARSDNKLLSVAFSSSEPTSAHYDHFDDALHTYATWLVRATRRKLAESGAPEKPDNSALIDLTSDGNKRTNMLVDNGISHDRKDGEDDRHS